MHSTHQQYTDPLAAKNLPWYRQFWPWFIIALPASAVIASFITLWLATSHPDPLVVDEDAYQQLLSELKVQAPAEEIKENQSGKSE